MPTMTLVPVVTDATIRVEVDMGLGLPINWKIQAFTRSDANGTRAVRLPSGMTGWTGDDFVHVDAEPALVGNVTYTIVVVNPATPDSPYVLNASGFKVRSLLRINLIQNPRAVNPGVAGTSLNTWGALSSSGMTIDVAYVTDDGVPTRRVTATAGPSNIGTAGPTSSRFAVSPGDKITAGINGYSSLSSSTGRAAIYWYSAGGSYLSDATGPVLPISSSWFTAQGIAPANAAFASVSFAVAQNGVTYPFTVEATNAIAVRVNDLTPLPESSYFDGYTLDTQTRDYAWSGTADKSESVEWLSEPIPVPPYTSTYIAPATLPRMGTVVDLVTAYDAANPSSSTVFEVIGRSDPLVSIGVQRTRQGMLAVFCPDYDTARAVVKTAGRGEVLFLRQPDYEGLDFYFVATNARLRPYEDRTQVKHWSVELDYVEVAYPNAPLLGAAGWNFETSGERNATFYDSLQKFGTFLDLKVGPVSG